MIGLRDAGDQEIVIGRKSGDYVSITPVQWIQSEIAAEIEIRCDVWFGRMEVAFGKGVLARFADDIRRLRRDLHGGAELRSFEHDLVLKLSGDGKGHIAVKGVAQNEFHRDAKLNFEFPTDQTFLEGIAEALDRVDSRA